MQVTVDFSVQAHKFYQEYIRNDYYYLFGGMKYFEAGGFYFGDNKSQFIHSVSGGLKSEVHYCYREPVHAKPIPRKEFDIDISFTKSEIENLIGKLDGIEDCGPYGEGWTSDELLGLLTKLNNALEDLK